LHAKKENCNPEKGFCMPSLLNFAIPKNKFACYINHFTYLKNTNACLNGAGAICIFYPPDKVKCTPKK
jgi:hypothetical protein